MLPKVVPIFFHNFSSYDCHLFIKELVCCDTDGEVSIIPNNMECYTAVEKTIKILRASDNKTFSLKLSFRDSYRFLTSSLEKLTMNLADEDFIHLKKAVREWYPSASDDEIAKKTKLLQRKGVFPYEVVKSFDVFDTITELPPKDQFTSCLNDYKPISDEDYNHAKNVWKEFKCSDLGAYSDLYLKSDVLLVSDIFDKFRKDSMDETLYGLDPANFLTLPGFAWAAMLKIIDDEIELITDPDMWAFVMSSIRGGFSGCSERSVTAENKYTNGGKPVDDPSYLIYMDANNLYGHASQNILPKGEFAWLNEEEVSNNHFSLSYHEADLSFFLLD